MTQNLGRPPLKLVIALVALVALIAKGNPKQDQVSQSETFEQAQQKRPALIRGTDESNQKTKATNWSSL